MKKLKALLWKEWREARLFFFTGIALILCTRLAFVFVNQQWLLATGYFILPLGFPLFGAFIFTNEFTQKTEDFLFSQSVGKRTVFWCKYLFGLAIILLLVALSFAVFYKPVLDSGLLKNGFHPYIFFLHLISVAVGLYVLIVFSSLLIKQPLIAICSIFILSIPILICSFPFTAMLIQVFSGDLNNIKTFLSLVLSLAIVPFIITIYLWETSITKDRNSWIQCIKCYLLLLLISWGAHFLIYQYSEYRVNKSIENVNKAGLKWERNPSTAKEINSFRTIICKFDSQRRELMNKYVTWGEIQNRNDVGLEEKERIEVQGRLLFKDPALDKYLRGFKEFLENQPPAIVTVLGNVRSKNSYFPLLNELIYANQQLCGFKADMSFKDGEYDQALKDIDFAVKLGMSRNAWYGHIVTFVTDYALRLPSKALNNATKAEMLKICRQGDLFVDRIQDRIYDLYHWYKTVKKPYSYKKYSNKGTHCISSALPDSSFLGYVYGPIINNALVLSLSSWCEIKELQGQPYYRVKKRVDALQKKLERYDRKTGSLDWENFDNIEFYLENRYEMEYWQQQLKLVIALKLYKAEHGGYPDSLAQLSPSILPVEPTDPVTGQLYNYKKRGTGFAIYSQSENKDDEYGFFEHWKKYKIENTYVVSEN